MRCKNCGWENPAGLNKCEKCNAPLRGSMIENEGQVSDNHEQQNDSDSKNSMKSTVRENDYFGDNSNDTPINEMSKCKKCGYEIAPGMNVCPVCGTPTKMSSPEDNIGKTCPKCGYALQNGARFCANCGHSLRVGTINAWDNPQNNEFCSLKPIQWSNEDADYSPISYSGKVIVLNRSNTDPNNQTITSKEQAVLVREVDSWYIEDRSEQHTTMIRVSKKTKLESGDIIALGNRLFEFKG